jgi:hypothetical protein
VTTEGAAGLKVAHCTDLAGGHKAGRRPNWDRGNGTLVATGPAGVGVLIMAGLPSNALRLSNCPYNVAVQDKSASWQKTMMQKRRYTQALERLQTAGLRPTKQRLALAKLLFDQGDRHVTAEQLHVEADEARVAVSLATI